MTEYLLARLHRKRIAFAVTGAVAVAMSLAMFNLALVAGASPYGATALRLCVSLPILYVGYSRYMLVEALRADRVDRGRWRAEARMVARVGIAIATSILLKLAIEPVLASWLLAHFGHAVAAWSPLAGDLGYGPAATYLVLGASAQRATLQS